VEARKMNKQLSIFFTLVAIACLGCQTHGRDTSKAKDVSYVSQNLDARFTIAEVCKETWQSATDAQCKIGKYVNAQLKKEVPSETVYKNLGFNIPSGQVGEQEVAKRQDLVNRITDQYRRQNAQAELDKFKIKVANKNALKMNLAKGNSGATCFGDSTIGDSGVKCSLMEAAMGGGEGTWQNEGLTWLGSDAVERDFNAAQKYCADKGARLPEKQSLIDALNAGMLKHNETLGLIEGPFVFYWSTSPNDVNPGTFWTVRLSDGYYAYSNPASPLLAVCVK
jgi:hypothetical protein